ncbi:hypothetical protein [Secundilactobacillus mixtipabuli]|uniref:Uncharacterized protein n=1 Tax=Secundilactobacillus mixtipabuli TaxID=1435342 RepID=A0A1Z5I9W6_9LACO|nr:hypothetical protein [Secundilactobacillus mixtipabuli]GAW98539.1 hypothetical protein IWT30_00484 [Secundilactobacillus mixtipabuli]
MAQKIRSVNELAKALQEVGERIDWQDFSYEVPVKFNVAKAKFEAPQLDAQVRAIVSELNQISRTLKANKKAWLKQVGEAKFEQALQSSDTMRQSFGAYLAQSEAEQKVVPADEEPAAEKSVADVDDMTA